jgi:hypothetical protein
VASYVDTWDIWIGGGDINAIDKLSVGRNVQQRNNTGIPTKRDICDFRLQVPTRTSGIQRERKVRAEGHINVPKWTVNDATSKVRTKTASTVVKRRQRHGPSSTISTESKLCVEDWRLIELPPGFSNVERIVPVWLSATVTAFVP